MRGSLSRALPAGAATGIGSLPHADARAAAELVLDLTPHLPAIPSLPATAVTPRRHPAEVMLAQVIVGVRGLATDDDGHLVVDAGTVDPLAPIVPDLAHPAFRGLRVFLDTARGRDGAVKWQVLGPVSLGGALVRRGVPVRTAYATAVRAVRAHLGAIHGAVTAALPDCQQVVFVDEPSLSRVHGTDFPLPAEAALDLVSGALATVEPGCVSGVHCCHVDGDVASLIATGPRIVSLPVRSTVVEWAGYLAQFLDNGGWVAWGAVPTDGPLAPSADRYWRDLNALWGELAQRGCDALKLRRQALVTPSCGLALHDAATAASTLARVGELAARLGHEATASATVGA